MLCPKCKLDTVSVIDKRNVDARTIRRRRKCDKCLYRFSTLENIEPLKVMVSKTNGSVEDYDRQKVVRGIMIAAKDRINSEKIEDIADGAEVQIEKIGDNIITSKMIGNIVARLLRQKDEVAYLRFVSAYKNLSSLCSLKTEFVEIEKNK